MKLQHEISKDHSIGVQQSILMRMVPGVALSCEALRFRTAFGFCVGSTFAESSENALLCRTETLNPERLNPNPLSLKL